MYMAKITLDALGDFLGVTTGWRWEGGRASILAGSGRGICAETVDKFGGGGSMVEKRIRDLFLLVGDCFYPKLPMCPPFRKPGYAFVS